MLNTNDVRGDIFYNVNNQNFSYSQYGDMMQQTSHFTSTSGPPKTAPGGATTRSHSIDATMEKRVVTKAEPGSFAEKEAMLLL
jgi:hypothetical protein